MPELTPVPKDKVDFSLDNRQIFFLFFGLSVVGCFVFALGVMVGRRGEPGEDGPTVAKNESRVILEEPTAVVADAGFSFKDGLQHPATAGVPETRDPSVPPRDEDIVRAERDAAMGKLPGDKKKSKKLPPIPAPAKEVASPKVMPPLAGSEPIAPLPAAMVEKQPAKDSVVASVKGPTAEAEPTSTAKAKKGFALQMKAFAKQEEADRLAEKLRRNGHDARVESGEANGRMWHRVRIGEFTNWDTAMAAKQSFEKQEQLIAYIVSM